MDSDDKKIASHKYHPHAAATRHHSFSRVRFIYIMGCIRMPCRVRYPLWNQVSFVLFEILVRKNTSFFTQLLHVPRLKRKKNSRTIALYIILKLVLPISSLGFAIPTWTRIYLYYSRYIYTVILQLNCCGAAETSIFIFTTTKQ